MAKKKTPDVIDSGTEIVKQKRKPAGMAAALAGDLGQEPGDNTRIVQTNMTMTMDTITAMMKNCWLKENR